MSMMVSFILKMMIKSGSKVANELDEITKDPRGQQEQLLKEILNNSKDCLIDKKLKLSSINDIEEYRKIVPLTDYDFFAEDISKMLVGEENILTNQKIIHYNVTSGTLGVPKKIPVTNKHLNTFSKFNAKYLNYIVSKSLKDNWTKGKGFSLCEGTYEVLPTGITIGCASSLHTAKMGKMIPFMKNFDTSNMMYTSPNEARQPKHLGTYTRYLHALFALKERNITYGNVTFSSYFLEILRFIEKNWKDLCNDIEEGRITSDFNIPDDVKESINQKLKADKERANELRKIFENGFEKPVVPQIWPKMEYILCVAGAGFQSYTDKLKERYLGDNVHILYLGITASEAFISAPIEIDNPNSVVIPNANFFEFIPVIDGERDLSHGTKLLDELELHKQYEIVLTNFSGLYRYQMKDVIEVTGFYNKTPIVQFVQRSGYAINMYAEKTSEKALQETASETCKELGLDMNDYCVCPSVERNQYIFMYEIHNRPKNIDIELIKSKTEENLRKNNHVYAEVIDDGSLKKSDVIFLQEETFSLYRDLMVLKGTSIAQLKPVHVTKTPYQEKFFLKLEDKD